MKAYLDHASASPIDPRVLEVMNESYSKIFGNPASLHDKGREANSALESAREKIAGAIHADPTRLFFTSGGCESNSWAIYLANSLKNIGKHVIISSIEHSSLIKGGIWLQNNGFEVTFLPVNSEGVVLPEVIKSHLRKDTVLVSVMHANNEVGTIQSLEKLARICHEQDIIFHTDCAQSLTRTDLNVKTMDLDVVSVCAQKINGPKGIGAVYAREGINLPCVIFGGEHESGLRGGTQNVPAIVGFAKAIEVNTKVEILRIKNLRDLLLKNIMNSMPQAVMNGSLTNRLVTNVHITFPGIDAATLLNHLNAKEVYASAGSACDSHSLRPSHVLQSMGLSNRLCHESMRFSLALPSTAEEISYTAQILEETIKCLKKLER